MKPRIAIAAYRRGVDFGAWRGMPACFVPEGYVAGVEAAGGLPFLVPPLGGDDAAAYLDLADGLVLTGGEDLSPALYDAEPHPATAPANDVRDASEVALLRAALDLAMPVLGICRGAQLLNVVYGGDLVQHLDDGEAHLGAPGTFARHPVEITGTRLRDVAESFPEVSSYHHQSLGRIGEGLAVAGTGPDGLVEAIEDESRDFCVGVLWHPEEDARTGGLPLFAGLVEAARRYAARDAPRTRGTPSRRPSDGSGRARTPSSS